MPAYIIGPYNPSVRIMAYLLTPLMLGALILYVSGETYSLMSIPNDRFILRNFFMAGLFTLRVFARILLRGSNIFHISFLMTDLKYEPRFLRLTISRLSQIFRQNDPLCDVWI